MSALTDAISASLIHSVWQDAAIAMLLVLGLACLRHRTANARYLLACAALALMALVPVATAAALYIRALRADAGLPAATGTVAVRTMAAPSPTSASIARHSAGPLVPDAGWIARMQPWALPVWIIGVLAFSLRLISAGMQVRRLEHRSEPADASVGGAVAVLARRLGVDRPVRVLVASIADGPATLGWLRPIILLPPAALMGITSLQLEALLAHELAHIRRHDYFVNVVQLVLETIFFYHPAVWWTSRRIRAERELCCDDIAVESCGDAVGYARALTRLARLRVAEPALGSSSGPLVRRIQRVLSGSAGNKPAPPAWTAAALIVAIAALIVTGERARGASEGNGGTARGVIRGQIVDAQSGLPVQGASVEARSGGTAVGRVTHADGRYEFTDLIAGTYQVSASARGYLRTLFGQAVITPDVGLGNDDPVLPVRVPEGGVASGIDIRMIHGASISGRVYDDAGAELSGVEVELLRKTYGNGLPDAVPAAFGQTEGPFSMFEIGRIPPGEYYVRAYLAEPVRPTRGDRATGYAPTFFPQATRIGDAQSIVVGAGQDILSLNISLATVTTHVVGGRLVVPQGTAISGTSVELSPIGIEAEAADLRALAEPNGRFRIPDVVPGEYVLRVRNDRDGSKWLGATRRVTIENDVTDLEIAPEQPVSIEGRFVLESGRTIDFDPGPVDVALEYGGKDGATDMDTFSAVQHDGTFSIEAPGGTVSARIAPRGGRPYRAVKAVYLDSLDVTDRSFNLAAGERHRLTFVYPDQVSTLSGEVADRAGHPAPYALVVVFPDDREQWKARLIHTAFAQPSGYYEIADLPGAPYRAIALTSLPRNAWVNPDVLDRLRLLAKPVRLQDGEHHTLPLALTPTPKDLLPQ
jgi:beta-lactamase regulating signal transducer with metallopeptidase domain